MDKKNLGNEYLYMNVRVLTEGKEENQRESKTESAIPHY